MLCIVKPHYQPSLRIQWGLHVSDVLAIFADCQNQSILQQGGIALLVTECMSRRRRVVEENQLTLAILHLEQLAVRHIQTAMNESDAWRLKYDKDGMAIVPPLRITRDHVFPILEREIHLLHRRPYLSNTVRYLLDSQHLESDAHFPQGAYTARPSATTYSSGRVIEAGPVAAVEEEKGHEVNEIPEAASRVFPEQKFWVNGVQTHIRMEQQRQPVQLHSHGKQQLNATPPRIPLRSMVRSARLDASLLTESCCSDVTLDDSE